jgi:transposase
MYPLIAIIHVFLDNARYHHAILVQKWLAEPGRRIKLHFIPAYCPHLNPIAWLWGVIHKHLTHNKRMARPVCKQFNRERQRSVCFNVSGLDAKPQAKMEIRALRSS